MSGRLKNEAPAAPSSAPASPADKMPGVEGACPLESESRPAGLNDRWLALGVCVFLAGIIWVVFGQTLRHGFVNYDDDLYVYQNPVVQKGLTWAGFRWALTYGEIGHWHPLTWLSHMLDCQWYGLQAGGHHLTNVLLHTAAAVLLFLLLRRMTGFLWRSAFVAAVFAIHPLRVESVAWVAERKDVLSAFFFMLTLWAYGRYVEKSKVQSPKSKVFYGLVLVFFALGLLSKDMLMTTPFVLLLLDYWPLGRLSNFAPPVVLRLVAEKIPLLVLTVGSCVTTFLVPEKIMAADRLPFGLRMENVVVSYVTYLWQMVHPLGLACLYPNPANYLPVWQVVGAVGLLLAICGAAWVFRRTQPWLVVGWLWYLGMLVPVIGLVQISFYAAHADRYTYLPQIGLYLMLTWSAAELCAGWRHRRVVLGGLATVILAALIYCARGQTAYWRDSESLWTHTLACTSANAEAHYNLGSALLQKNRVDEAMVQYQRALQIKPGYADVYINLGNALNRKGSVDEAIAQYQKALQIKPDSVDARDNLGNAFLQKGRVDEAMVQYQKALQIKPDHAETHLNLGNALNRKGSVDEAIAQYQKALQIKPGFTEAHIDLGDTLLKAGRVDEAILQYQAALQIKPDSAEACYNLGIALFQKGRVDDAIKQYQRALQIKPGFADAHINLGRALFQIGRVDEAITQYQRALQIKPDFAEACNNLGNALLETGRPAEAIPQYQKALQIRPDYVEAMNNLASLLATCPEAHLRNGVQAVRYAQRACELTHYGVPIVVGTLAAAYAEAGQFDDAIVAAQKACALASAAGEPDLLERNQEQLKLYRAHQPYHEAAEK